MIYWDLYRYLVGDDWNMTFLTFHILGMIISIDELIFFRGVETTNQIRFDRDGCLFFHGSWLMLPVLRVNAAGRWFGGPLTTHLCGRPSENSHQLGIV